jgi:argonaute-like protein implicated in RNA metabolism and viral defense
LRDGPYRRGEASRLLTWGQEIGATFLLVAVIKEAPRILTYQDRAFIQPVTGTVALPDGLPGTDAMVVSSLPPDAQTTPQPLLTRAYAPYPILEAVQSVLAWTTLHGGSVRPPRQPVPLHAVQRIGHLALKGILPQHLSGAVGYWV